MAKTSFVSPTAICAADIAVLHLLHSVPSPPFQNSFESIPVRRHDYNLPFETERRLTSTLAFLSNVKHDVDYIPAVAIVEGLRPSRLSVLVAVNRASHDDGNNTLQRIKEGFEGVFVTLSQSAQTPDHVNRVLEAIISMCSERILVRLRLAEHGHWSQKQKQPIIAVINEAILPLQRLMTGKLEHLHDVVDLTLARMKSVIKLVNDWTQYRTNASLKNVVIGMHDLWQVGQLHAMLEAIPNREMSPSSRKNLHNTVRKVARYCEAARTLCRLDKKNPIVHRMIVVPVKLPPEAFHRSAPIGRQPTLEAVLNKFKISRDKGNIEKLHHILQVEKEQAAGLFTKRVSKTLTGAKIHAEIQIIFYCELNRTLSPPRMVRSSKNACFLCNTFISMYKEIYTPRCHGRLYPGWRLPQLPTSTSLQMALNEVLEQLIDRSLRTMLSTEKKIMYPEPNESSLSSLPLSASTLSLTGSISSEQTQSGQIKKQEIPPSDPSPTEFGESKRSSGISDYRLGKMDDGLAKGGPEFPELNNAEANLSQSTSSALSELSDINLEEGSEVLHSINHHRLARLYRAGPLEVYLECSSEPTSSSRSGTSLRNMPVKIKRLSLQELEACHTDNDVEVIDAHLLCIGADVVVKSRDIIHIAAGGSVLRIEFCRRT